MWLFVMFQGGGCPTVGTYSSCDLAPASDVTTEPRSTFDSPSERGHTFVNKNVSKVRTSPFALRHKKYRITPATGCGVGARAQGGGGGGKAFSGSRVVMHTQF